MRYTTQTQISELASEHGIGLTDETGERVTVIDEFDWEESR